MTPQDVDNWNKEGCVDRSILKAAQLNGSTITREDFAKRFGTSLDDSARFAALEALGIPLRDQTQDYERVMQAVNIEQRRVLVKSEIDLSPGSKKANKHCSVLLTIDPTGFRIWTPLNNGGEEERNLTRSEWSETQCTGQILGELPVKKA